ncbi:MAG: lysylphosphatidylglycerol synthase transmembrane domain-containing protein [Chitinophagales bacterium]
MREKIISALKSLVFLAIGLGLVWWFVKDLEEEEITQIKNAFSQANYAWLFFAGLIGIISHVSRSARWQILLEPLGHKPGFANTFYALMVGYLANIAFPRLGEISRCALLNKYEKIPVHQSIGTVFVDRIMDLITLALLLIILVVTQFDLLFKFTNERLFRPILKKLIAVVPEGYGIVVSILSVIITVMIFFWLTRRFRNSSLVQKIKLLVREFVKGFLTIKDLDRPYMFVFHSISIWLMYYLSIYVAFQCMDVTSNLGPGVALSILVFGTFAFILVQGGLGAYPIAVMEVMLLYGVTATLGFAFGWIVWVAQTVFVLILGVSSLVLLPLSNKNKNNASLSATQV